jgi:Cys-tRNA(Pro) deacylase
MIIDHLCASAPAMSKHAPETLATQMLRQAGAEFTDHLYDYVEHGGTQVSATALAVDEYTVIKTLVMEDERKKPLLVLMHGTMKVSTKALARAASVKTIEPCKPDVAQRHTGFMVGGTSPFGIKKDMPIFMEATIMDLPRIYINGGRRGYLVGLDPKELIRILNPVLVKAGAVL